MTSLNRAMLAGAVAVAAVLGAAGSASAHPGRGHGWHGGSGWSFSLSLGWPVYAPVCAPVYVEPAVVYRPRYYYRSYEPVYYSPAYCGTTYVYPAATTVVTSARVQVGAAVPVGRHASVGFAASIPVGTEAVLVPVQRAPVVAVAPCPAPAVNVRAEALWAATATDRGDYGGAVTGLRRAVAADPAAFCGASVFTGDRDLAQRVSAAAVVYQNPPRGAVSDADSRFMVAALSGSLGDRSGAIAAAQSARASGDATPETAALERALRGAHAPQVAAPIAVAAK